MDLTAAGPRQSSVAILTPIEAAAAPVVVTSGVTSYNEKRTVKWLTAETEGNWPTKDTEEQGAGKKKPAKYWGLAQAAAARLMLYSVREIDVEQGYNGTVV